MNFCYWDEQKYLNFCYWDEQKCLNFCYRDEQKFLNFCYRDEQKFLNFCYLDEQKENNRKFKFVESNQFQIILNYLEDFAASYQPVIRPFIILSAF